MFYMIGKAYFLGKSGQTALWCGFFCMSISCAFFYLSSLAIRRQKRAFHNLAIIITGIASLSYLVMASGYGWYEITDRSHKLEGLIPLVRYCDWLFTTPLLLYALSFLYGAAMREIIFTIGMDFLMIISGLLAAIIHTPIRWAFFTFSMLFYLPVLHSLLCGLKEAAKSRTKKVACYYSNLCWLTIFTWSAYPFAWLGTDGFGHVSQEGQAIIYCILDVSAKCVFSSILLYSRSVIDECSDGGIDRYERFLGPEGGPYLNYSKREFRTSLRASPTSSFHLGGIN